MSLGAVKRRANEIIRVPCKNYEEVVQTIEACTNRRFPLMRPRYLVAGNSPKSTVLYKADRQTTIAVYIIDMYMYLLINK